MEMLKLILLILISSNYICLAQSNTNIKYINHKIEDLIQISKIKNLENKISIYSIQLDANEKPEKILNVKKNIY